MEYRAGGQEVRGQGDSRQRLVYTGIPPTGNQPGLGWEDKAGNGAGGRGGRRGDCFQLLALSQGSKMGTGERVGPKTLLFLS